jgi:hypothetical protein
MAHGGPRWPYGSGPYLHETVLLWWGLFDNELYVEHGDKRFGPYLPDGGPIPLHRYRAFKKTPWRNKPTALRNWPRR